MGFIGNEDKDVNLCINQNQNQFSMFPTPRDLNNTLLSREIIMFTGRLLDESLHMIIMRPGFETIWYHRRTVMDSLIRLLFSNLTRKIPSTGTHSEEILRHFFIHSSNPDYPDHLTEMKSLTAGRDEAANTTPTTSTTRTALNTLAGKIPIFF